MNRERTRNLTVTSLLATLTLLLGLTPIGYPPNPLLPVFKFTLMCIPVIIGTIVQGLKTGLFLSLVFGVTSFLIAIGFTLMPDPVAATLFGLYPLRMLLIIFIPRLVVPVTTFLVYRAITGESQMRKSAAVGTAAVVGSITNTVLFLGGLYLLLLPEAGEIANLFAGVDAIVGFSITADTLFSLYAFIGGINGLPEAIAAAVLCIPIAGALMKTKNKKGKS